MLLAGLLALLLVPAQGAAQRLLPVGAKERLVQAGQKAALAVQVVDETGKGKKGVPVAFALELAPLGAEGARISTAAATTDRRGVARVVLTTSISGTYQVSASNRTLRGSPIVFTVRAQPAPGSPQTPAPAVIVPSVPPPQLPLPVAPPTVPAPALPTAKPLVVEVVSPKAKAGQPKTLILVSQRRELTLGSAQTSSVKIKAYGTDGKPLPDGTELTLAAENLRVIAKDANEEASGLQLKQIGGLALLEVGAGAKPGRGSLTVTVGDLKGSLFLPVVGSLPPALIVEPPQIEARAGEAVTLRALLRDTQGNRRQVQAVIELLASAGAVDKEGKITFRRAGETVVLVKHGGLQRKVKARVAPASPKKVEVIPLDEPRPQGRVTVVAKVSDAFGNLIADGKVRFSVEGEGWRAETPEVSAGSDKKYYVEIVVGTEPKGVLTASYGELQATKELYLPPGQPVKIAFSVPKLNVPAGEERQITLIGKDAAGRPAEEGRFRVKAERGEMIPLEVALKNGEAKLTYRAPKASGEDELTAQGEGLSTKALVSVTPGPVAHIELNLEASQILPGKPARLKVRLLDRFGNETTARKLRISADKGSFIGGSETEFDDVRGVIEVVYHPPAEVGGVVVQAEADGVQVRKTLSTGRKKLTSVVLTPEEVEMKVGEAVTFRAIGRDAAGAEVEVEGEWVAPEIGHFEKGGVFRATKAGEGVVRLQAEDLVAEAKVRVRATEPHDLMVALPSSIPVGELLQVEVTVTSEDGRPVLGVPVEASFVAMGSSASHRASTSQAGKAKLQLDAPTRVGPTRIQVKAGNLMREVVLEVTPGSPVTLVAALSTREFIAGSNQRETLKLKAYDAFGNLTGDGAVVTLESEGLKVLAKDEDPSAQGVQVRLREGMREVGIAAAERAGEARITASLGPRQAVLTARVRPGKPVALIVEPWSLEAQVGETVSLQAYLQDRFGNRVATTASLHVPDGLRQTGEGQLLLTKPGTYRVQANRGVLTTSVTVTVKEGNPAHIELIPLSKGKVGGNMSVVAKVLDRFGNLVRNGEVAFSLDQEGWEVVPRQVKAGRDGKYYVKIKVGKGPSALLLAKMGTVVGTARLDVAPGPAVSVFVVPERATVAAFEETEVNLFATDAYGGVPETIVFTARAARGRVPKSGRIVGGEAHLRYLAPTAAGEDEITVETPAGKAKVAVLVKPGPAAQIRIQAQQSVRAAEKAKLEIAVLDAHGNLLGDGEAQVWANTGTFLGETSRKFEFAGGKLTLLYEAPTVTGEDVVRVKVGDAEAQAPIKIAMGKLVSFEIEPARVELRAGEEAQFRAIGRDRFGNEGEVPATWRSEATGQMDKQSGLYRATRAGRGAVEAEYGEESAQAEVVVRPGPPVDIKVEVLSEETRAGESARLRATVSDAFGNPVPNVQLFCRLRRGGVEETVQQGMSDEAGQAEFDVVLPSRAGHVSIEITSPQVPKSK